MVKMVREGEEPGKGRKGIVILATLDIIMPGVEVYHGVHLK